MVRFSYNIEDLTILASSSDQIVDPEDAKDDNPVIDESAEEVDTFDDEDEDEE